ncbi:MAG: universal stress protein [Methyloligellaceae bacterium]
MAFKDLLVHLDNSDECEFRVNAAVALAKRQKSSVSGVALALESTISTYIGIDIPSSLSDTQKELVQQSARSAVEKFEKAADDAGVSHSSKIVSCGAPKAPAVLAFHARHSDMAFLGQPNPDSPGAQFQESLLEGVLFASGRPVYIVPYIGRPDAKIRKAVIAWDGGKKAVRAVNDAIPLLQGRGEAIVLVINPEERREAHGDNPGADIAAHLERHGVKAKVEILPHAEISKGTVILNYLSDSGADLLVMGAFGHSRLREKAFGGATDTILHQMTAPVLMSE